VPDADVPEDPNKPGLLQAAAGKLAGLISTNRKRRDRVEVNALTDLQDDKKQALALSMIDSFEQLDADLGARLSEAGIIAGPDEPFGDKHLNQYIQKITAEDPSKTELVEDMANDWLELFEFQSKDIPQGAVDPAVTAALGDEVFADRIGRLTQFRRDTLLEEAELVSVDFDQVDTTEIATPLTGTTDPIQYMAADPIEQIIILSNMSNDDLETLDANAVALMNSNEAGADITNSAFRIRLDVNQEFESRHANKALASLDLDDDGHATVSDVEKIVNDPDLNTTAGLINDDGSPKLHADSLMDSAANHGVASPGTDAHVAKVVNGQVVQSKNDLSAIDFKEVWGDDFDIDNNATRVGIIVIDKKTGKMLLRRPTNDFGGYRWTYAKGGIDEGESVVDAALREVSEETGIPGDQIDLVDALPGGFGGFAGSQNHFLIGVTDSGLGDGVHFTLPETASETEDMVFVSLGADSLDHINLTPTDTGRERDIAIHNAVQEWVDLQSTGGPSSKFGGLSTAPESVVKKSSGLSSGETDTSSKKAAPTIPNTVAEDKAAAIGMDLVPRWANAEDRITQREAAQTRLDAGESVRDILESPDMRIEDMPPTQDLFDTLVDYTVNPGRYENVNTGDEGINGMKGFPTRMVKDTSTGELYVLKRPARNDGEHLSELSASIVTDELGIPQADIRLLGDTYTVRGDETGPGGKVTKFGDTTNRAMIIQPSSNLFEDVTSGNSGSHNVSQIAAMLAQQYLINEPDNHPDNRVSLIGPDGDTSVFAFDAGKAFIPHDEKFGPPRFGGKFGTMVDNLDPETRTQVLSRVQSILDGVDSDKLSVRIANQGSELGLTGDERARLDDIADFVGERHGGWREAFAASFPDDVFDPANRSLPARTNIVTPVEDPKLGQLVKRDADPGDKKSYERSVAEIAVSMTVEQGQVDEIQAGAARSISGAMEASADAPGDLPVHRSMMIDGPDIVGGKATVTGEIQINVGTFDNPETELATEIKMGLEDHTYEQVQKLLQLDAQSIYEIQGAGAFPWSSSPAIVMGTETNGKLITFGVTPEIQQIAQTLREPKLLSHSLHESGGEGNSLPTKTTGDVISTSLVVADFGDVKMLLMPDAGVGKHKATVNHQLRVFVTGDTRAQLAADPQATLETVMRSVGIDARPPTEVQIRARMARNVIRFNTKPRKTSAPDGGYGLPYGSSTAGKAMLANLAEWDVKPSDIVIDSSRGYPLIKLSDEAAIRIAKRVGAGGDQDERLSPEGVLSVPSFKHDFSSGSMFGTSQKTSVTHAQKLVDRVFRDGNFASSTDRKAVAGANKASDSRGAGLSPNADIGVGSGVGTFFVGAGQGRGRLSSGHFYMFPELGVARLDHTYGMDDQYGTEDNFARVDWTGRPAKDKHYSSISVKNPFDALSKGADLRDNLVRGTVSFNDGLLPIGTGGTDTLQQVVRDNNIPIDVLNAANLIIADPSNPDKDRHYSQMIYWVETLDGPELRKGPSVLDAELQSVNITGRMKLYKPIPEIV